MSKIAVSRYNEVYAPPGGPNRSAGFWFAILVRTYCYQTDCMPLEEACRSLASYIDMSMSSSVRTLLLCRLTYGVYINRAGSRRRGQPSPEKQQSTRHGQKCEGTEIASQLSVIFRCFFDPRPKGEGSTSAYTRLYFPASISTCGLACTRTCRVPREMLANQETANCF